MNKHIEKIIKSVERHKKGLRDPQIMHPEREWAVGIALTVTIFVLSATWSLTLYLNNRNAAVATPDEQPSEMVVYRESMVQEALNRLESRASVLESLTPGANSVQEEVAEEQVATSTEEELPEETEVIDEIASSSEEVE